jgi:hypothetical protein
MIKKEITKEERQVGSELIVRTEESISKDESFVKRVVDAAKALDETISSLRLEQMQCLEESSKFLNDFRMTQMATSTEVSKALKSYSDVRQFFLNEEHVEQMTRLKEFVEVLTKLKEFKDNGFIDAVADTILKLEK